MSYRKKKDYENAAVDRKEDIWEEQRKQIVQRFQVVIAWWALIIYPFIAEVILSSMFCFPSARHVPDPSDPTDPEKFIVEDVYRLKVVPDIICYDKTHLPMMIIFGFIPLCGYLIYIPGVYLKRMKENE